MWPTSYWSAFYWAPRYWERPSAAPVIDVPGRVIVDLFVISSRLIELKVV